MPQNPQLNNSVYKNYTSPEPALVPQKQREKCLRSDCFVDCPMESRVAALLTVGLPDEYATI